ncbi:type I phosphomannose isomerase catalytic subunit [Nonlabens ponticola]|uniref:Mannose-6-phosphate isomerase n=1 Tax=Nonlabens ponticola TaxID=2496866 RepID=A0A3S9MWQ3_9FLAO|nr:type I phosphomannose isomerase catalytic subunit [Nonlabens ponticola]AZQ43666.1 mannose-6-phosphate isomerase [Nonlabens ponticola]
MTWYPLTFEPILLEKIWGGQHLNQLKNIQPPIDQLGESWEISTVPGKVSVVDNGDLKGHNLQQLLDTYPEKILGARLAALYGNKFPLLIKFINAAQDLSIQVHPDDEMAGNQHNSFGKSEMWYVMDARPGSQLTIGFENNVDELAFAKAVQNKTLPQLLNNIEARQGDAYMIAPGTVHAIGAGITLAEIQQSSDITYRVYDYDRKDSKGNTRELHIDAAMKASNLAAGADHKLAYDVTQTGIQTLESNQYFTTRIAQFTGQFEVPHTADFFTILINVGVAVNILHDGNSYRCHHTQTYLLPAAMNPSVTIECDTEARVLIVTV